MRSHIAAIPGCFLALVLERPAALAQASRHGAIVGYVSAQTGRPLGGIKVMAMSPSQTGAMKVAYSDEKGTFRLRQLRPGTFELRFTGADLKALVRRGVLVTPASQTEVRVTMEVEIGGIEEVRILDPLPRRPARLLAGGTFSNARSCRCNKIIRAARGTGEGSGRHTACWVLGGRPRRSR